MPITYNQVEKQFGDLLDRHSISLSELFDAQGAPKRSYHAQAKSMGKLFVVRAASCFSCGETVRTRNGECISCRPASVAFQRRSVTPGFVYLARSAHTGLFKIGSSKEPFNRLYIAALEGYGGAYDWEVIATIRSAKMGYAEHKAHTLARQHSTRGETYRFSQVSRELYRGNIEIFLSVLETCVALGYATNLWSSSPKAKPN